MTAVSSGGRAAARERMVKRAGFIAAALVLLAVVFLISGHWIMPAVFAVAAAAGIWAFRQIREVR